MKNDSTIYIAPGSSQCRVYFIPYLMKPEQEPQHILIEYQKAWVEIGLLNFQLQLVYLNADFGEFKDDIEGQMGGTFFSIARPVMALAA